MLSEKNQALISVVIPVFNGEKYIDGLFAQFSDQNMDGIELVFIDDGSTDSSYERLISWQNRVTFRMQIYHWENKGVSAARNFGVSVTSGKYLTFLDVDDGISPSYFSILKDWLQQDFDILTFDSARVKVDDDRWRKSSIVKPLSCKVNAQEMLTEFLMDPTQFGVYNLLLRREYLSSHDISFPVGYKYYEDYDYLIQVFAQTNSILRVKQVLYYYILREGSAMGRFNADRINCLKLMKYREDWLRSFVPEFASMFKQWGIARLYWSVLWQAALALPTYGEFKTFAEQTYARQYFLKLKAYPDKLLRVSRLLFLSCKPAFYFAARFMGRAKSKIIRVSWKDIQSNLESDIKFY